MKSLFNKTILIYLLKFGAAFCFFYFGTLAIIGLSAPGGYYSGFVAKYLNFIPAFRDSLLYSTKYFLSLFGFETYQSAETQLRLVSGSGINLVYKCLGYGVTSFWLAFVFANTGTWKKKLLWMIGGAAVLYIINVLRIGLVLLAASKSWEFPLGWDHHTWFNIVAYGIIFLMMWVYDRRNKVGEKRNGNG